MTEGSGGRFGARYEHGAIAAGFVRWLAFAVAIGLLAGSASALFLVALEEATRLRTTLPWLLYGLPAAGALVSWMYMKYGAGSGKGNNLILERIQRGEEAVPLRMAPFVLVGTVLTHLFGGSAGREGTAVQMGGSLAEWLGARLRLGGFDRRMLLMCGVSAGFGSVFGTPLAGAVFGLEVAALGVLRYEALFPCFAASLAGHWTTTLLWGVHHPSYAMGAVPPLGLLPLAKVLVAGALFGLMSLVFSEATHGLKAVFARWLPNPALRSAVGGTLIIGLTFVAGTRDYLGLSLPLLSEALQQPVHALAFAWKTLFTAVTLGAGYQGGEVTPLFVIGAALGNALSGLLHLPAPFLAALGLVAVFSGAANTPLACFLMGLELFGADGAVYLFAVCAVSYLFSGHTGIYASQRIGSPKHGSLPISGETTIGAYRQLRRRAPESGGGVRDDRK